MKFVKDSGPNVPEGKAKGIMSELVSVLAVF
jgi:hypothetical protein